MLTIAQARKIEPMLEKLSDEQILDILEDMYGLSQLAYEKWTRGKTSSKNPTRVLRIRE